MSYQLNLPAMFCVPCAVADEHLKLARELELKVLLWLLRHGEHQGMEALAQWLGKPEGDLINAVQFWIDRGVLTTNNEQKNNKIKKSEPLPEIMPARPNQAQILTRIGEDANLQALFKEADKILGRTIGHEGQCMLLILHDSHGLPVEVIYMLLRYCKEIGKTGNAYLEAVGRDWGAREIDTLEKADMQIEQLKANLGLWNELRKRTGIQTPRPSSKQHEFLRNWTSLGFGLEMIHLAYDEAAEHTGKLSFSYMNKVLESWHASGTKTPEAAAAAKEQFRQKNKSAVQKKAPRKGATAAAGYGPSFDLDKFEQSTYEDPVLRRKP